MLGFLFGFNVGIGRVVYILATIALAFAMTAVCFAIAGYYFRITPRGMLSSREMMMTWPVITAGIVLMAATFTLQSMRVRDIGWDPVCVIPAWITILLVDSLVASKFPAWSLGQDQHGTVVGGLINLGLFAALMFWPGADYEDRPFNDAYGKPGKPSAGTGQTSAAAARIARLTGA